MRKHFLLSSIAVIMLLSAHNNLIAQERSTKQNSKEESSKTTSKEKTKSDNKDVQKSQIKSSDNLFTPKNRAWSIDIHGGYPLVQGDIRPDFGIGYGINIRKALGYSFSLMLDGIHGYTTGIDYKLNGWSYLQNNSGYNGVNNPASNYFDTKKKVYMNYKMTFTKVGLNAVYNINNINFMNDKPRLSLYLFGGIGGLFHTTYIDALDASGNMYDFSESKIHRAKDNSDRKQTLNDLKNTLDGKYETLADGSKSQYGKSLFNNGFSVITTAGIGASFKINEFLAIFLSTQYGFTGSDLLDGQQYFTATSLTSQSDAFIYSNIGISIKLSKKESVSWFDNPLTMPYQTIAENKKRINELKELPKKMDELTKRVDSAMVGLDSLKTDSDNDGVADYFDRELNTPDDAIVDGAGRTIFFKNDNGDLVFNDPNVSERKYQNQKDLYPGNNGNLNGDNSQNPNYNNGNNQDDYGNNGNNQGNQGNNQGNQGNKQGNYGNNQNNNGNYNNNTDKNGNKNTGSKTNKYSFNKNDPDGKTIVMRSGTDNMFSSAGTNSNMGFMPAVFFDLDQSVVKTAYYPNLYEIARMLKSNPTAKLNVVGYTDFQGSEKYNKSLGKRRADAVVYALTKYFGANPNQLSATTQGENLPLTNLKSGGALAANRRVQFELIGSNSGMKSDFKNTSPKTKTQQMPVNEKRTTPTLDKNINDLINDSKPVDTNDSTNSGNDF